MKITSFDIRPHEGCGAIAFGDKRTRVRAALGGEEPLTLKRNEFAANSMDVFDGEVFVYYDADDRCEAVEISAGKYDVFLGDLHVFGLGYAELKNQIHTQDPAIAEDETGFTSLLYGIGVYAPNKEEEPDDVIETIIVHRKGYYDKE